ncbi:HDOD domain-containing protein [Chitinibacter bivalviorum]|uniref:HDOD domain-containing protein n=1 Tax=Chitinibacter bivalviorum TaxID=2739434 RepID=A0A7H9BH55_9NEIS|nr:HDOD domain-containing protein [Chitinibacter bivalviorum]QLG87935.1 HDOD domain-containing protein [Chitinibacter bivalviorum]
MFRWLIDKLAPPPNQSPPQDATVAVTAAPSKPDYSGLLRRRAIYNRHWQIAAYALTLRELPHAKHSTHAYRDDEVLLCQVERLLANHDFKHTDIWVEMAWSNIAQLLLHDFSNLPVLRVIAHGNVNLSAADLIELLPQISQRNIILGATAKHWHQSHPTLGEQLKIVALSIQSPDFAVLSQQVAICRQIAPHAQLWINDVDSREAAEACFQLGADFVSGQVFTWPEAQQIHFPDSFIRLNQILQLVRQNADAKLIADELKSDPALSARLLRYVNSAALGLSHPISNLDQAIVVVGNQRLYRWLSLLLFSSKGEQELDETLLEAALNRARLMELAGQKQFNHVECELLFLTGLFSLLDFLLRVPRALLLKELNPPEQVIKTLLGDSTPFTPYFELALSSELAGPSIDQLAACQLSAGDFNRLQMEATLWTFSALAT